VAHQTSCRWPSLSTVAARSSRADRG
jgi:hypothetical protein